MSGDTTGFGGVKLELVGNTVHMYFYADMESKDLIAVYSLDVRDFIKFAHEVDGFVKLRFESFFGQ